jgi:hypothetical protein
MKPVSLIVFFLLGYAAQAAQLVSCEDNFSAAALNLCVAVQIERLDDGVISEEEIASTVVDKCREEIESLAQETSRPVPSGGFRSHVKVRIIELVHSFRTEEQRT